MRFKVNPNAFLVFLVFLIFLITKQLKEYVMIMIFAFLHELTHLAFGIIIGFKVKTLKIMPVGFYAEFEDNIEDFNRKIMKSNILAIKKIIISLSGPLFNLLIAIVGINCNFEMNIVYTNFLIFLINMFPIYPLDGGRILKNIFKLFYGNKKANQYINNTSNAFMIFLTVLSSIIILINKNIAIFMLIMTLWVITIKENIKYNTYKKVYKTIDKTYNYL